MSVAVTVGGTLGTTGGVAVGIGVGVPKYGVDVRVAVVRGSRVDRSGSPQASVRIVPTMTMLTEAAVERHCITLSVVQGSRSTSVARRQARIRLRSKLSRVMRIFHS